MNKIKVTIWHEYGAEKILDEITEMYPKGQHAALADGLAASNDDFEIRIADLNEPDQGLPDELLENTDVLIWWSHFRHNMVEDSLVDRICDRVRRKGMGFIALHSSHCSKPFCRLVGTTGSISWGDNVNEILWTLLPQHPIAKGIPPYLHLASEEVYSEPFCIGSPDEVVFGGWFETGNFLRSGCCFYRGMGKVFYFQPGHETCPAYYDPTVLQIIANAVRWAAPTAGFDDPGMPMIESDKTPVKLCGIVKE